MSFWSDLGNVWDSITNGDWSGAGNALGNAWNSGTSAVGDAFSSPSDAVGTATSLSGIGDYTGGLPVNTTSLGGIDAASAGSMPVNTTSLAGLDTAGLGGSGSSYGGFTNGAGMGDAGLAASGGAGTLSSVTDWAKKNPSLVKDGISALGTLTNKNSPAAATTAGYNASSAANAGRAAVGNSLINQAPFLANNAEANAINTGNAASAAKQQQLQQQGYKPGDAMYDSAMQQQNIGNATNRATAYAAGQGQNAQQQYYGAGLLTPNLSGYGEMGKEQNLQQGSDNTKNADLAGLAKSAFDIWANPDKKTST